MSAAPALIEVRRQKDDPDMLFRMLTGTYGLGAQFYQELNQTLEEGRDCFLTLEDDLRQHHQDLNRCVIEAAAKILRDSIHRRRVLDALLYHVERALDVVAQTRAAFKTEKVPELIYVIVWDFGDGTNDTTNSSSVAHKFSSPGTYTVKATATDGGGLSASSSVVLQVVTSGDSDSDGWSDELEIALGTNPTDAASTPFGLAHPVAGTGGELKIIKILNSKGNHRVTITGSLGAAKGVDMIGKTAIFSINGMIKAFVLDKRGASPNVPGDYLRFTKVRKGKSGSGAFKLVLRNGNLSGISGSIGVNLIFDGKVYLTLAAVTQER